MGEAGKHFYSVEYSYKLTSLFWESLLRNGTADSPAFQSECDGHIQRWCLRLSRHKANDLLTDELDFILVALDVQQTVGVEIFAMITNNEVAVVQRGWSNKFDVGDKTEFKSLAYHKLVKMHLVEVTNASTANVVLTMRVRFPSCKESCRAEAWICDSQKSAMLGQRNWLETCFLSAVGQVPKNEETFSDVICVSKEGQLFHCHKQVIARNETLRCNLLSGLKQMRGDSNLIDMSDISSNGLVEFLRYLYLNEVETSKSAADQLVELFNFAEKHLEPALKKMCALQLLQSLEPSNACQLLLLADKFNESLLKERCLQMINRYRAAAIRSEAWKTIVASGDMRLLDEIMLADQAYKQQRMRDWAVQTVD